MTIVLGVHDTHNPGASLFINGELKYTACEEHLSRTKHEYGFPKKSIDWIFNKTNIKKEEIDLVTLDGKTVPAGYYFTRRNATFSISDYWREQKEYWYPKIYLNENPSYTSIFKDKINLDFFPYDLNEINLESNSEEMWNARINHLSKYLNISKDKINHYDHHKCHAAYGQFMNPLRDKSPTLIITIDGGGDGINATISISEPYQKLYEISRSSNCNIGRMYRYATLIVGMRPTDHEYKMMGLAAYNTEKYGGYAYETYAETLQVNGIKFNYKKEIKDHFFYFKDKFEGVRFDAIAYGIQRRTEELMFEWIQNIVNETKIRDIVMCGGVAQNIKANQKLIQSEFVDSLYIPPGPGDESISLGGGFLASGQKKTSTIKNAYFYLNYYKKNTIKELQKLNPEEYSFTETSNKKVAELLASGEIVARHYSKEMEFGARALGNRSFLADPRSLETIHTINKLVKVRDFWMPFAPSIKEENFDSYMIPQKGASADFMAIGFNSTVKAQNEIPACLHPFDKTARPQIVRKNDNPEYHNLISCFEEITGIGVLLNTSFNIHGEPIVASAADAISTLKRSGLRFLFIDGFIVEKLKN